MNSILSIWFISGIVIMNVILILVGCLGKVSYFPSLLSIMFILYSSSMLFILGDQLIKWNYYLGLLYLFKVKICYNVINYYIVIMNIIVNVVFIKFIITIKHLAFMNSINLFIIIYLLIIIEDSIYSIVYLINYFVLLLLMLLLIIID